MLLLRALDPAVDIELFRTAYSWRSPKRHVGNERMTFADFTADAPNQIVMGLFNGQLCAVYMFIEVSPKTFEAHFTSRRGTNTALVLAGARTMVDWFHGQGAIVTAEIVARNRPLRQFVETLGFTLQDSPCQNDRSGRRLTTVRYFSSMDNQDRSSTSPVSEPQ